MRGITALTRRGEVPPFTPQDRGERAASPARARASPAPWRGWKMAKVKYPGHGSEKRERSIVLHTRWTPAEDQALRQAADSAGMSVASYLRHQALGTSGPRSARRLTLDEVLIRELIGEISRVGNNLNQLTRLANMGDLEEPRDLAPVLHRTDALLVSCMAAIGRET